MKVSHLTLSYYFFTDTSKEKMANLGFIPVSCQVVDKFAGDILKDLPFLTRYGSPWVEWMNDSLALLQSWTDYL